MSQYRVEGKVVGNLNSEGTLVKKGRQVMLFNIFDGFGIPDSVLQDPAVERIEVHYAQKVYRASYHDFLEHGVPYHRRPFEPQTILPRKFWNGGVPKQPQLFEEVV